MNGLKSRLSNKSLPALYLVVGLLMFTAMTLLLGEISEDIINHEPLIMADAQLSTWLHIHRSAPWVRTLWIVTSLHSTLAVSSVALIIGLYLVWRKQPYWLVAVWLSVFGGMLLNKLLKFAFHRARPHFDDPILTLTSYSFPSGHTMMATVLYGVLAAYFVASTKQSTLRVLIILLASLMILLVGFSRIYLGAHYLSDVVGAMAEGLAWLSLSLIAVYSVWRKRHRRA
jgi:membrane-associated phospholipid phosphatase